MLALSVAYFFGVFFGVVTGLALPWWLSGVTGWLLGLGLWLYDRHVDPHDLYDGERERAVRAGVAFGAWSGAAAAEVPEVLNALVWPGHEHDGAIFALIVAVAWLIANVIHGDDPDENPLLTCACLYAVVLLLAYLPPALEVL